MGESWDNFSKEDLIEVGNQLNCFNTLMDNFSVANNYEKGQFLVLKPTPVHLPTFVNSIVQRVQRETGRVDLTWNVVFPLSAFAFDAPPSFCIEIDQFLLNLLLYPLISNACIYSEQGSTIDIIVACMAVEASNGPARGKYSFRVCNPTSTILDSSKVHGFFQKIYHMASSINSNPHSRKESFACETSSRQTSINFGEVSTASPRMLIALTDQALRQKLSSREGLGLGLFIAFNAAQNLMSFLEFSAEV